MKARSYPGFACCVAELIIQACDLKGPAGIGKNKGESNVWGAIDDSGSELSRRRHTRNDPAFLALISVNQQPDTLSSGKSSFSQIDLIVVQSAGLCGLLVLGSLQ